jgi:hypothetical protein
VTRTPWHGLAGIIRARTDAVMMVENVAKIDATVGSAYSS